MMETEQAARTAAARRGSSGTPEVMRAVRRTRSKTGEWTAKRLDEYAKVEARESDINYVSRMGVLRTLNSVGEEI